MPDDSLPAVLTDHEPTSGPSASDAGGPSLASSVEAVLLTVDRPVSAARLAEALGLASNAATTPSGQGAEQDGEGEAKPERGTRKRRARGGAASGAGELAVRRCVDELNEAYEASGRSFRIVEVAGGFRVMTLPEFAGAVAAFHRARQTGRLSRAAIETLAIIAYRQPITRAHLEAVRGVACGEVLRSLMERRLVTIKGRAEELGRPILYGTTKEFLDAFGLGSLKDLPTVAELQAAP